MMSDLNTSDQIILENDRVKLRPLIADDINNLLPIAHRNPDLLKYSPSQINTEALLASYIKIALNQKSSGLRYPFVSFDKKAQAYSGCTSYGNISNQNDRVEIGWTWIGKDFQGTGLNKAQKSLMLRYAFEELGMKRVELKTDTRNIQSRRAMEKIGATPEGTLRSHTVMSDGFRRDTIYYSILAEEWPRIKADIFSI